MLALRFLNCSTIFSDSFMQRFTLLTQFQSFQKECQRYSNFESLHLLQEKAEIWAAFQVMKSPTGLQISCADLSPEKF